MVKQHGGHGFVVDGAGTTITNSNVDGVGLDGFVVTGAGSTLSGNGVQNARHGFIVTATGLDTDLDTNETEALDGDGFVVDGDSAVLASNSAQANLGRGFVIGGDSGLLDTNTAEAKPTDSSSPEAATRSRPIDRRRTLAPTLLPPALCKTTGFTIAGTDNHLNNNAAEQNTGSEWVIGPNNVDDCGNKNGTNVFTFTISGGTFN